MSKIILLNGACGVWKSTIAKLLHDKLEFSLLREKDVQRRNLSHYKDTFTHQKRSWKLVMALSKHAISFCIENKLDLIFDGILREKDVIQNLESYIHSAWGEFVHIYLNSSKDLWQKRLEKRWIWGSLSLEKAICFYDNLVELSKEIKMIELDTSSVIPEETCSLILDIVK